MTMLRLLWAVLLLSCVSAPLASVQAAQSAVAATAHDRANLVSATDSIAPGGTLWLGLRLHLAPGWHIYWSNPGDAGEPPEIAITSTGAAQASAGPIDWPTPRRLPDGPLMSYGYTGDVLLPVPVRLGPVQSGMVHLDAKADWLVCATICVPESARFTLALPRGTAAASPQAPLFDAAFARVPRPSPFAATLSKRNVLTVSGQGLGPGSVRDAWFLPAEPGLINQDATQKLQITTGQVAIMLTPEPQLASETRLRGVVVLRDPTGRESFLSVEARRAAAPAGWRLDTLPGLLLSALLGGIVLNLMPCVFPVLAMKALALARISGAARKQARSSAWFYAAGVLAAFASVGGLMQGLRAAGSSVGWGFQFQSAAFVAGTCWLLFAVGLNLAGLFEVGVGITGAGQGLAGRRGHVGDFATGVLAVLVATPCTAPFMAVAIAGAFRAPAAIGVVVFLAMGLGLALPYVALALLPGLARLMPRPGAWMAVLRQALAFPLFASCAWLAWLTSIEGGDHAVLALAAGMVLLGFAGWLLGLSQRLAMRRPAGCVAGAALAAAAALALLPGLAAVRPDARPTAQAGTEPFSEARLAALRAAGRPVFVDMTAAWCVTCLVNERLALSPASVRHAFAVHHVALLRGDWTLREAPITAFLRAHGRDGVPFYVYYPKGGPARALPQILTAGRVLDALNDRT